MKMLLCLCLLSGYLAAQDSKTTTAKPARAKTAPSKAVTAKHTAARSATAKPASAQTPAVQLPATQPVNLAKLPKKDVKFNGPANPGKPAVTPVTKTASAGTTPKSVSTGVPKDAVETAPGFFRWTDKEGKVWTYRQTSFGVTRWPADSVDAAQGAADKRAAVGERTVAVDQGDSIRFEQATPFGKHTWSKKKTDLNDAEQRIWDLQQKSGTASRTAEKE